MNRFVDVDVIADALSEIRKDVDAELNGFFGSTYATREVTSCVTGEFVRVDDLLALLERLAQEAS